MKTVTFTLDEVAYRKFTRKAKEEKLSRAEFARQLSNVALGIKVSESSGNGHYEEFSDKEVRLIIERYKEWGPTELSRQIEKRWGKNRLPATISNKAAELGVRKRGQSRKSKIVTV